MTIFNSNLHGFIIYPSSHIKSDPTELTHEISHRMADAHAPKPAPLQLELPKYLGGTMFASQYDQPDELKHEQAASRIFDKAQMDFASAVSFASRMYLGLPLDSKNNGHFTHLHGIGAWENNVEPSMMTIFHKPITALQLQKIGADVGSYAYQHGIILFSPFPEGSEQLMHMRVPTHDPNVPELDPRIVADISKYLTNEFNKYYSVDSQGVKTPTLPGRSYLPDTKGHTDVLVWVPPFVDNPQEMHEAFMKAADSFKVRQPVQYWNGQGLQLGGTSPYNDDEAKHFSDVQKRELAFANYERAKAAKFTELPNPVHTEALKFALDPTPDKISQPPPERSPSAHSLMSAAKHVGLALGLLKPASSSSSAPVSSSHAPSSHAPSSSSPAPPSSSSSSWAASSHSGKRSGDFNYLSTTYIDPDALYAGYYGYPEETFVSMHPFDYNSTQNDDGRRTHYQILEDMIANGHNVPDNRSEALGTDDLVLGRTGDVYGERVVSFWNPPHHESMVKDYVREHLKSGHISPTDWISFRGVKGLIPAEKFAAIPWDKDKPLTDVTNPDELIGKIHNDPIAKARWKELGGGGAGKTDPWREALLELSLKTGKDLLHPGQNWRYPWEAQRQGEPTHFAAPTGQQEPSSPSPSPSSATGFGSIPSLKSLGLEASSKPQVAPQKPAQQPQQPQPAESKSNILRRLQHFLKPPTPRPRTPETPPIVPPRFITPDDLYVAGWGQIPQNDPRIPKGLIFTHPTETFVAMHPYSPDSTHVAPGIVTHGEILDSMHAMGHYNLPQDRPTAVHAGLILGRKGGKLNGRQIISFWNHPNQEEEVKQYIRHHINSGDIHPEDWISFRGAERLQPAGEFAKVPWNKDKPLTDVTNPDELIGKIHNDPVAKARWRELGGGGSGKIDKWREALLELSLKTGKDLLHPGQNWRYPWEAQRQGEPTHLDRAPAKTGTVIRGVYYAPGMVIPDLITASSEKDQPTRLSTTSTPGTLTIETLKQKLKEYAKLKKESNNAYDAPTGPDRGNGATG